MKLDAHLIAQTRPVADPANVILWGDMRVTVLADRLFRVEKEECRKFLAMARFRVHGFIIDDIQCAVDDYIYLGSG